MDTKRIIKPLTDLLNVDISRFTSVSAIYGSTDRYKAVIGNLSITLDVWGTMWKLNYWLRVDENKINVIYQNITDYEGAGDLYLSIANALKRWEERAKKIAENTEKEEKIKEDEATDNLISSISALM